MKFPDDLDGLSEKVQLIQSRLLDLLSQSPEKIELIEAAEMGELLSAAVEELNVANVELRQQDEELISTRLQVEMERQRYRDLFDSAPDGYIVTDTDGVIREANRPAASMLGKPADFLTGKPLAIFLGQEERRLFRSALISFGQAGIAGELEIDLRSSDKNMVRASLTVAAMHDRHGVLTGLRWLLRDSTPRHDAELRARSLNEELERRVAERTVELEEANRLKEEALAREQEVRSATERAERRLRDLVNGLDAIIWEADPATFCYTYVSDHAITLLGYTAEEWKEETFDARLIHPEDLPGIRARRRQLLEERRSGDLEYRVLTITGGILWVHDAVQVVTDVSETVAILRGVIVDITHQHEADRALRESESRLRRLVEANIIGVLLGNRSGAIHSANSAFLSMVGYSLQEIVEGGVNWARLTPAEYIPVERRMLVRAEPGGVFAPFEKEFIHKSGMRVPVLVGGAYLDDTSGDFVCFVLDLTDQKHALEALRLRDRAIAAVMSGIILTDPTLPDMPIVYVNPAMETITGYSASELLGQNPRILQGMDTDGITIDEINQALTRKQPSRTIILNYRKDGTPYWCEISISPVRNPGGQTTHFVGIIQDVTERIEAAEEIRRLNHDLESRIAEFQTLLDVIPIGIAIARDPECREVSFNPALIANLPISPDAVDALWRANAEITPLREGRPLAEEEMPMQRAIRERKPVHDVRFEIVVDGQRSSLSAYAAPLFDEYGNVRGAIGAFVNISNLKNAEDESTAIRYAAEAANRAKDRFLAILSHELRTPLTPVIAASQILAESAELPVELMGLIEIIGRNIDLEVRLIDDLLDLTGIETGKLRLRMEVVDAHEMLTNVLQMFQGGVIDKHLRIILDMAAGRPRIKGDPARLQQIFWNLVKNAVKFTPEWGSISISTRNQADGRIVVAVKDSGMGIDPAMLDDIFEPFVQANRSDNLRGFSGLGLGLAISKALVEMHGGSISVQSAGHGHGASFMVMLDVLPESEDEWGTAAEAPLSGTDGEEEGVPDPARG